MESSLMGKVLVSAKIENLRDIFSAETGALSAEEVRSLEVHDALVDTSVTMLSMPRRLIEQLGLKYSRTRRARTSAGPAEVRIFGAARLTIQERECLTDVSELPDDCPVLIGQLPLEALDFVVDPVGQRLIGNPDHGGEHIIELY